MTPIGKPHILIVIAEFYQHIAELQINGAKDALNNFATFDIINVPGALEIPATISMAAQNQHITTYHGFVALGCVIRGETTHYETVCTESARALMDLSIQKNLAIGNGILTVENKQQAIERADPERLNKAGGAASACLTLIKIFETLKDNNK